jgi:UDP-N-acetyl-D-mannosaminuronic acid transferase (WecB/TagA/CpsF family)
MPLVCVGAAFDFHAGTLPQAPAWMQARGLEWLYRLTREPRRLWRRYTTYIPVFVALVSKQYLMQAFAQRAARSKVAAPPSFAPRKMTHDD